MRKAKIMVAISLSVILIFVLCNRDTSYPLSQSENAIATIEIVAIENYKIVSSCSFDKILVLSTIDENKHDEFLTEFYDLKCKDLFGPSQEVIEGMAIRFTYNDGAFELVTAESGYYYTSDQRWSCPAYAFDYDAFHRFLYSYIAQSTGDGLREP